MSSYDIKRLRELLAKATKGPWEEINGGQVAAKGKDYLTNMDDGSFYEIADARLICAMRNALPCLLDDLEACVEALKFYADKDHYLLKGDDDPFTGRDWTWRDVLKDNGERASATLDALLKRTGGEE